MKLLERVVVAAPCPMSWDMMEGDDKVRHCGGCSRNVYNLSAMNDKEAEAFLQKNGSSQCLTFYRRADGTIMTDNCPKGLQALRDKMKLWSKVAAGLVASIVSLGMSAIAQQEKASERVQSNLLRKDSRSLSQPNTAGKATDPASGVGSPGTHQESLIHTLGEATISVPPQNNQVMNPAGGISFTPVPVGKKTVLMPTDCTKTSTKDNLPANIEPVSGDKAAYNLFTEAQNSKVAGKDLVALTQFKSALNLAKGMKHADPQFMRMIEIEINTLQSKLQNKAPIGVE